MKNLLSHRFIYQRGKSLPAASGSQRQAIEQVRQKIAGGEYTLQTLQCPCGTSAGDITIAEVDRYGLPLTTVICMACGTIRLDPYLDAPSLEDFYLRFYQQMYARAENLETYVAQQQAYGTKILSVAAAQLPPNASVVEVGCGAGGALQVFQDRGYRVAGCDYSERLIAEAKKNGIEQACHGTLSDAGEMLGSEAADLIYLHHVFEHLNDPLDFLITARQYLNQNGRLILVVPDVSRIDRFPNPDGDLMVFLHLAHKHNFSVPGLHKLCERAGYQIELVTPDPAMKPTASTMPELWVELREAKSSEASGQMRGDQAGEKMRAYLANTERLFLKRMRRRAIAARLKSFLRR
jgi:SAM-dependent methyltransferase